MLPVQQIKVLTSTYIKTRICAIQGKDCDGARHIGDQSNEQLKIRIKSITKLTIQPVVLGTLLIRLILAQCLILSQLICIRLLSVFKIDS